MFENEPELTEDEQQKFDEALVQKHVDQLMEHFESVRIFVSKVKGDNTASCTKGGGNWFAQYGTIVDWVTFQEQLTREQAKERI